MQVLVANLSSKKYFLSAGRSGKKLDQIEFVTNMGIYGPFGGGGGGAFSSTRYDCKVVYFSGNSGEEVDAITVHYECPDV